MGDGSTRRRDQAAHDAFLLPHAVHAQQRRTQHLAAVLLHQVGPDDHVDVAGFVFDRDEQHAPSRCRPLAHGDDAGAARQLAIAEGVQHLGRQEALSPAAAGAAAPADGGPASGLGHGSRRGCPRLSVGGTARRGASSSGLWDAAGPCPAPNPPLPTTPGGGCPPAPRAHCPPPAPAGHGGSRSARRARSATLVNGTHRASLHDAFGAHPRAMPRRASDMPQPHGGLKGEEGTQAVLPARRQYPLPPAWNPSR